MTPESLAEKIVQEYLVGELESGYEKKFFSILAAQIREAEQQAVKKALDTHWNDWEQVRKECRKEGFNAAREKAVCLCYQYSRYDDMGGETAKAIAERIQKMEVDK